MCVDYLSYQFDEMDLAVSWRVITKQKKKTWAKQRNNLKTISPQTLNWLKDSDVTWLYGPLHTVVQEEEDPFLAPRRATAADTLGLMLQEQQKPKLKPALKKVTKVDLLKRSVTELDPLNKNHHHRTISLSEANEELKAVSPAVLATHRQPKLRFNTQVEQCIAITAEEAAREEEEYSSSDPDTDDIVTSHVDHVYYRRSSIKKIAPARLKKSHIRTEKISTIHSYKEKSHVAEPALVTMHQTATDINKSTHHTKRQKKSDFPAAIEHPSSSNHTSKAHHQ
ncbi:uncharacterized protein B0P05DRAFT_605143 [Gilbertella persicaria]|uniref:uncharacterized protein n=1 Tax=Gilbertella persicaria TaxID=101096 RepID=UPI00221F396F|nr:uncharacterized protein B0P05DRAFT_605143 [Gilbertella persicaria]KAI8069091.1 hypothetical protein B0P05DRAFT_605143 [Gilbertella persicaria]